MATLGVNTRFENFYRLNTQSGSAGPRRFRLPITVGRMTAEQGKLRAPKSLS
jgi:hypothetical protein